MKHAFLRRLGALALALALTASLCVSPVWAEDPPDPPALPDPTFSTELIVLQNESSPAWDLIVNNVAAGEKIKWTVPSGVTLTVDGKTITGTQTTDIKADSANGNALIGNTAKVTAKFNTENAKITAQVIGTNDQARGKELECYVYCGVAPYTIAPSPVEIPGGKKLPDMTSGETKEVTITFKNGIRVDANNISFFSSAASVATIGNVTGSGSMFKTTITAGSVDRAQTTTITMRLTANGGYQDEWKLTVNPAPDTIPVQSVRVSPTTPITMNVGDTHEGLKAEVMPKNATNKTVTWSSSDESVVMVDKDTGKITAVGVGRAKILASAGGVTSLNSCAVEVKAAPASVKLDKEVLVLDLAKGDKTAMLTATAGPGTVERYTWTSSNSSVVACDTLGQASTVITAKKAGSARIGLTVRIKNGTSTVTLSAYCNVTVLDDKSVPVDGVKLSATSHTMPEDGTFTLSATVSPNNAPVKTVTWSSSDPSVATVDKNGKVTALKSGYTSIIATADFGGASDFCDVTITPKAERIDFKFGYDTNSPMGSNHYTYTFKKSGNDSVSVRAVLAPTAAADPIHWVSKDPAVATVSAGTGDRATVTAVSPGEAIITAVPMAPDGKDRTAVDPAQIKVTVSGLAIQQTVDGNSSTITSLNLAEGRRTTLSAKFFGAANTGGTSCDWSISDPSIASVGTKNGASTTLTARRPGTATLTARLGAYSATCTVTVGEDAAVTITATTPPGSPLQFSKLASQLQSACQSKTGSPLSYVTNLSVASTDQGILHDQHHSSADTGGGVGVQDRYYPGTAPQGQRSMNDLSFVPRNTFSGTAEITYTAWSTKNQSFNGTIRVTVNGTGDVMYSSNEDSPVTFLSDDFNLYHPNVSAVTFTLPLDSVGTLYHNYTSPSQPGTKVTAGTKYYRTGTPSLDRVTFVPAAGYKGTVRISYQGTDTGGRAFTGVVTITVNGGGSAGAPGDIYYPFKEDSWTTFRNVDFQRASQAVLGESLSYVRFSLPPSSEGTLFYNYRGFGNYDSAVASTTSYYYSGTPALNGVSFVPTTTSPSQVDITYTGYTVRGNTFTGTIHIGQQDTTQPSGLRYTAYTGKSVNFSGYDFNAACVAATGASLNYVQFTQLPAVGQGTLRYTRGNSGSYNNISTTTRCYRSSSNSWDVQLSNVSFLASGTYTGTVTIPFVGYDTNNTSFTGQVVVTVTPPTTGDSVFSGTTASPIRITSSRMRSLCSGVLDKDLSYITFTSLPSSAAGRLYQDYNGFRTGTQVNTGTRYYVSGSPSIDQLSFVPRGRYSGRVTVGYTATDTGGKSTSGLLTFNITNTGSSSYFSDLGYHAWAAPAVDYLYLNGVTKGVTPNTFGPEQRILRCDFVLMLCRAFGFGETGGYSFADVPTNAYYAGAVAAAKQRGIVSGDGRNFMPNSELTRQDAMVMIYNAMKAAGWNMSASTSILGRFPDGTAVASYARDAVSALVQMGAVNGDNGMLYPYNPITRAEAAVILHFVMTM